MKLIIKCQGQYTDITEELRDCWKGKDILYISVLEGGLVFLEDALEMQDLEENLEYIVQTRNVNNQMLDTLDRVKNALLGKSIVFHHRNKSRLYVRSIQEQKEIRINIY